MFRLLIALHEVIFDATRGRVLGRLAGMPVVKLITRGRRSGRPRTTMLTSPVQPDGTVVLVASNGGADRHPDWYLNLHAHPEVGLVLRGRRLTATARTATAGEKAALWPEITAAYADYGEYQERTDRDIPVVICAPHS